MLKPSPSVEPTPMLFMETVNAYQRTAALRAAIELDLFSIIGKKGATAEVLARESRANARAIRILCDYLVTLGFLTKSGDQYVLTRDSAVFLDRESPACMAGTIQFLLSPRLTAGFDRLTDAVRKGGTILPKEGTVTPDHPVWVDFARSMAPLMMIPAMEAAKLLKPIGDDHEQQSMKVLDIAAGHGLYGVQFALQHRGAKIFALDWPNVLEVAKRTARSFHVADRYETIPGNAFEVDFGTGYDVVLLPNFLHHFDFATCVQLLKRVHACLVPGGKVITVEFIPDENRSAPTIASAFPLVMLATTPSGDAYTFKELESMFSEAGFANSELFLLGQTAQNAVVSTKSAS